MLSSNYLVIASTFWHNAKWFIMMLCFPVRSMCVCVSLQNISHRFVVEYIEIENIRINEQSKLTA